MQLVVNCKHCNHKIILSSNAKSRAALRDQLGLRFTLSCPICKEFVSYDVHDVIAESNSGKASSGAVLGGIIGLLFGPEGALLGSIIGGAAGFTSDEKDKALVLQFNESTV